MKKEILIWGPCRGTDTFSKINREWVKALRAEGIRARCRKNPTFDQFRSADLVLLHDYRKPIREWKRPPTRRFIAVRSWDFGRFPRAWVKKIRSETDALWVYSQAVKSQAIRSGLRKENVTVIPLGFDEKIYFPRRDAPPSAVAPTVFLFVGGLNLRKGLDILIDAFRSAFSRGDKVELWIKAHRSGGFYPPSRDLSFSPSRLDPRIRWVDRHLTETELATLYQSSTALVLPYRAEGFGLVLLEAMACAKLVVAPKHGACLDFCGAKNSLLVPTQVVRAEVKGVKAFNAWGDEEEIGEIEICETRPEALAEVLRSVHETTAQRKAALGERARRQVAGFTWRDSARKIVQAAFTKKPTLEFGSEATKVLCKKQARKLRTRGRKTPAAPKGSPKAKPGATTASRRGAGLGGSPPGEI